MNKYKVLSFFRKLGLIRVEDKLRFYLMYLKTYSQRKQFLKENKSIKIPPAYHIYETFGLNLFHYYNDSIDTAKWLLSYFEKYKNNLKIAIRRVWYGQASNSEHGRAKSLMNKEGNASWVINRVSGMPKIHRQQIADRLWLKIWHPSMYFFSMVSTRRESYMECHYIKT